MYSLFESPGNEQLISVIKGSERSEIVTAEILDISYRSLVCDGSVNRSHAVNSEKTHFARLSKSHQMTPKTASNILSN